MHARMCEPYMGSCACIHILYICIRGNVCYARIYSHIYTYIHTYTYILTYMHTYSRAHIHTYIYIYIHTYIHAYIHLHKYIDKHDTRAHTDTDAHTHTYTHAHAQTHTPSRMARWWVGNDRWDVDSVESEGTLQTLWRGYWVRLGQPRSVILCWLLHALGHAFILEQPANGMFRHLPYWRFYTKYIAVASCLCDAYERCINLCGYNWNRL